MQFLDHEILFTDELDSYMYQTVGHQAIDLYAEAMGLPLFRQTIKGTALGIGRDYLPQEADEVEDLYELLQRVKVRMFFPRVKALSNQRPLLTFTAQ